MSSIKVTPEEMERTAGRIESLAGEYQQEYNRLYETTNAMAAVYQGKDSEAFISQIEGFRDDFEKMHSLMLDYSDFLKSSAGSYRDAQERAAAEVRKLTN